MSDTYEIRKGVPIPSKEKVSLYATIRRMSYGDSIVIPVEQRSMVHPSAKSVGAKVMTRGNPDGTVTVWRIDRGAVTTPDSSSSTPPQPIPGYPKIERTAADPAQGLPAGYYIQEDPYGPRVWVEGGCSIPGKTGIFG